MAFEAFLTQRQAHARPAKWRRLTIVMSICLHGALLPAAVFFSFGGADGVTPPTIRVPFAGGAAPPPPPPAALTQEPPKPKKVKVARPEQPRIAALVEP